jgi:hypothetical protein
LVSAFFFAIIEIAKQRLVGYIVPVVGKPILEE